MIRPAHQGIAMDNPIEKGAKTKASKAAGISETQISNPAFDELVEEFTELLQRGESPTVVTYVEQYPDLAEQIEELFPSILMMEQLRQLKSAARRHGGRLRSRATVTC
jgi:hypothetical protein